MLTQTGGLTSQEVDDVDAVLAFLPRVDLEVTVETEGEEGGILEGDLVTFRAWIHLKRGRVEGEDGGKIADTFGGQGGGAPHTPLYPYPLQEHYWVILADVAQNVVFVSQRVMFGDNLEASSTVSKLVRESLEGEGKGGAEVDEAVKEAVAKVKNGARLAVGKFPAPAEGIYNLTALCVSPVWLGCDRKTNIKLKVSFPLASSPLFPL